MSFETCLQGQIPFCYTCGLVSAGATYLYCATLWHVVTHGTYELSVWYNLSFAGPIYHNALTSCAAMSCRALRRVNRLCSRTLSDTANMSRHGSTLCSPTVEKLLCRSLFSERSHVGNLRQTKKQRETGVKRVETVGVYPLAHAAGRGDVPPSTDGEIPRLIQAKNLPPVRGEHACGSSRPPLSRTEKSCSQYSR